MKRKKDEQQKKDKERKMLTETHSPTRVSLTRAKTLHWISNEAALEVSFPSLLCATQRYSPLSVLLTSFIVNCWFSAEKLILGLLLIGDPSLVHEIVGTGFPSALQDKVKLLPSGSI